jgi:hypothetical protein
MPEDTSNAEPENIDVMIAALKTADSADEVRLYSRAIARHVEQELVGLSDVVSHYVDALSAARG